MSKPVNPPPPVVKALKKGDVNAWNKWVKEEKISGNTILIDGLNFSEIVFTKKDIDKEYKESRKSEYFEQIDLSGCLIRNCKFSENIMSVNFTNSTIENCNFEKNHFICSTFTGVKFNDNANDNASNFKKNEYIATNINLSDIKNCPRSLSWDYTHNIIKNIDDCGDIAEYGRRFYRKKEDIETPPLEEFFDRLDKKLKRLKIDLVDFDFGKGAINEYETSHSIKTFPGLSNFSLPTVSWYTPSLSLGFIETNAGSGPKFHVNFCKDFTTTPYDSKAYDGKDSHNRTFDILGIGFGYVTKSRNLGFYLGSGLEHYANETIFDVNGAPVNIPYKSTASLRPVISGGFDIETGPLVLTGKFSYDPQKINNVYFDSTNFLTDTQIKVTSKTPFLANIGAYLTIHGGYKDEKSKATDFLIPREIGFELTAQGSHTVKTDIPSINYSGEQNISMRLLPSINFR